MGAGTAQAYNSCDDMLIDTTQSHVLNATAVEASAQKLRALGIDVRVRAFQHLDQKGLDKFFNDNVQQCTTWFGWHDRYGFYYMKSNLIVFMFSVDGQYDISYGDKLSDALDKQVNTIKLNVMEPAFQHGDFTGGITAAMDKSAKLIADQQARDAYNAKYGHSGWFYFGIVIGCLVGLVIVGWVIAAVVQASKDRAKWHEYFDRARKARTVASDLYMDHISPDDVRPTVVITLGSMPEDEAKQLSEEWVAAQHEADEVSDRMQRLLAEPFPDHPDPKIRFQEYYKLATDFEELSKKIQESSAQLRDIRRRCDDFRLLHTEPDAAHGKSTV